MDACIKHSEKDDREARVEQMLARYRPDLIGEGFEAYKRDLPQLLREHESGAVAYRGDKRVGFAPTQRKLEKQLAKQGYEQGELFVTRITHSDMDDSELSR